MFPSQKQREEKPYLVDDKEVNDIRSIDSKDIKTINVYKGQSMTSQCPQYKDVEGVILIVTKKAAKP